MAAGVHGRRGGDLPPALMPLRDRAAEAALFCDYDGTLAPIAVDPAGARPLPGVPELLARLGSRLGLVAVVSGRPLEYLVGVLGRPAGVHLCGLYGMEEIGPDGERRVDASADAWRSVVAEAVASLARAVPPGVEVEPKGVSVTLHWRRAPGSSDWALGVAEDISHRTGLVLQPARMAIELRPPVHADKGTVVERLAPGYGVLGCFGDDLADLPAFAALARFASGGATVARVAVTDAESPGEVAAAADLVVAGPKEAVALLEAIAGG